MDADLRRAEESVVDPFAWRSGRYRRPRRGELLAIPEVGQRRYDERRIDEGGRAVVEGGVYHETDSRFVVGRIKTCMGGGHTVVMDAAPMTVDVPLRAVR